jgi:signal transduction histidine kinase
VGSTLYAQRISSTVNEDAISIATNAAPAIQHLSDARGELVTIAVAASSSVSSARTLAAADLAALTGALAALREHLARYLEQPFYPQEAAAYAELDRAVSALEDQTVRLEIAVASNDRRALAERLEADYLPAVLRADRAIARVVVFNAQQQRRMGLEIPRRRRHAHHVGYALQIVTALLGLVMTSFVISGIREHAYLLASARAATRTRDDVLAAVSHDLRNPIHAIDLTARAMRRRSPDAVTEKQVSRIERSTERMSQLIQDLLGAAKIEAGQLHAERQPEDAANLVESAVELFRAIAEEKSIRIEPRPPPRGALVSCDRHLILRVLANLISNAVKFSPRGGAIVVAAECLPDQIRFSVGDQGPGIPAELRDHVFDRYWQQKTGDRRGSGLGLYIAKGIVDAHAGRIWIDGAGPGTTVLFTLPVR